jgi:hypothetical protein
MRDLESQKERFRTTKVANITSQNYLSVLLLNQWINEMRWNETAR